MSEKFKRYQARSRHHKKRAETYKQTQKRYEKRQKKHRTDLPETEEPAA